MNINSDSDSEPEDQGLYAGNADNGTQELSLVDDGPSVLIQSVFGENDDGINGLVEEEGEGEAYNIVLEASKKLVSKQNEGTQETEKKPLKKKKKKKKWLYICLSNCKYDVVHKVSMKFGFKEVSDDDDWSLYWTDLSVALERVMDMKKYQKINHFPGMSEICRKDLLARNMNRMLKMFPKEYNVFPKTWCLPADYGDFQTYSRQKKNKTYILKPESGCQGRGIWVTRNPKDIKPHEHMICQQYLSRPLLIDGFKFDLRIYALVTSCDPLRIFVFKDGLARFATNKYMEPTSSNVDNVFMHLTNYAINKNSEDFIHDDEAGSKRKISTTNCYMAEKGMNVEKMWVDIDDAIIKTLISAHSTLKHNYRTCFPNHVKGSACFEILGFDVMLDRKLHPYILEVNHSPSFTTDSDLDTEIKGALIWDTLQLVNFGVCDRRKCIEEERRRIKDRLLGKANYKETREEQDLAQQQHLESLDQYELAHLGNFRRIYPAADTEKYEKYFHSSGTLFQETITFKVRSEMARQQREEFSRNKERQDLMMKGKKSTTGMARPESPGSRKKPTLRRTTMPANRISSLRPNFDALNGESGKQMNANDLVDTKKPMDILEEEELERMNGLLQRDNLVRGLGIVEHVYRLLHCTPGTMNILKSDSRPMPPPLKNQRWLCSYQQTDSCLSGQQAPVKIKDKQYYKKLMDHYSGHNHDLASDNNSRIDKTLYRSNCNINGQGPTSRKTLNLQFPNIELSNSSSNKKVLLTHEPYMLEDTEEVYDNECNKYIWKPLGGINQPGSASAVTQVSEYHNMSSLLETDADRNRNIARNVNSSNHCNIKVYKTDTMTPNTNGVLSASLQRKNNGYHAANKTNPLWHYHLISNQDLSQFESTHEPGLSVVSGPAPVVQQPDPGNPDLMTAAAFMISSTSSYHNNISDLSTPIKTPGAVRTTKAQRIRGSSINGRLRQMENQENHNAAFS